MTDDKPSSIEQTEASSESTNSRKAIPSSSKRPFKRIFGLFPKSISLKRIDETLNAITSIVIRTSILAVVVFVCVFLYRELDDKSYHIQEFQVPEDLIKNGYDGKVVAYKIGDYVKTVINTTRLTWSPKEIEEYNQSADRNQVKLEVAGVGVSPDAIVRYLKQVIGITTKDISGFITIDGKYIKCSLGITGQGYTDLEEPIINSDVSDAIDKLIRSAARQILKITDPLLLGIYYAAYFIPNGEPNGDSLGIKMFRYAILNKPEQASNAYAWWARSILNTTNDSAKTLVKIKKSLEINPDNAMAYRFWSGLKYRNREYEEADKLIKKSLSLDSTSGPIWEILGRRYLDKNGEKDKEAELCFRRSIKFGPRNFLNHMGLCQVLFYEGKFKEFAAEFESFESQWGGNNYELQIASLEATKDTASAKRVFDQVREKRGRELSSRLNNFAFELENRDRVQALHYVRLSIKADSTYGLPYTTLAEIYGLNGDDERFYQNLEKAFKLGIPVSGVDENAEPYHGYLSEERYQKLKSKYRIVR